MAFGWQLQQLLNSHDVNTPDGKATLKGEPSPRILLTPDGANSMMLMPQLNLLNGLCRTYHGRFGLDGWVGRQGVGRFNAFIFGRFAVAVNQFITITTSEGLTRGPQPRARNQLRRTCVQTHVCRLWRNGPLRRLYGQAFCIFNQPPVRCSSRTFHQPLLPLVCISNAICGCNGFLAAPPINQPANHPPKQPEPRRVAQLVWRVVSCPLTPLMAIIHIH